MTAIYCGTIIIIYLLKYRDSFWWNRVYLEYDSAFSSRLGYEEHIPGQTRDWNEEIQTTRELPRKHLPERLIRERTIFKVSNFFGLRCSAALSVCGVSAVLSICLIFVIESAKVLVSSKNSIF